MDRGTGDTDPPYTPQELFLRKLHLNWFFLLYSLVLFESGIVEGDVFYSELILKMIRESRITIFDNSILITEKRDFLLDINA